MPELPEVETVRLSLEKEMVGKSVERCHLFRTDYLKTSEFSISDIHNQAVKSLERHGKQLALIFANGLALVIHLGMSGRVFWPTEAELQVPPKHLHFQMLLAGKKYLFFVDPRRFGSLTLTSKTQLRDVLWKNLGPDALEISRQQLFANLGKRKAAIKSVLLNQSVIAGLGNIYADEILFESRIHPCQTAHTVSTKQVDKFYKCMRVILHQAIASGGSTLRDHISAKREPGSFQKRHQVYGRAGHSCLRCGSELQSLALQGRTTVFCSTCSL